MKSISIHHSAVATVAASTWHKAFLPSTHPLARLVWSVIAYEPLLYGVDSHGIMVVPWVCFPFAFPVTDPSKVVVVVGGGKYQPVSERFLKPRAEEDLHKTATRTHATAPVHA